jgi:hypothetical protein
MSTRAVQRVAIGFLAVVAWALSACTSPARSAAPVDQGTEEVEPVFREFYNLLGGEKLLGPAVSQIFDYQNRRCQYTYNVLMCYDPLASDVERFSLFPLGPFLELQADPSEQVLKASVYAEGYPVYEEFKPLYERLFGDRYVGKPLTAARTNYLQNRIEQYFENMGFYRQLDEPANSVHLLAYGGYLCDMDCRYKPANSPGVILRTGGSEVEQPFLTSLIRMGGLQVFGQPLTQPYIAGDGSLEQVYENVVLYSPPGDTSQVRLRSTPAQIGVPAADMVPDSDAHGMIFYPIQENLGYQVPELFDQFIAAHGGPEISGRPINAVWQVKETLYRQCFENYCLDFDVAAPKQLQTRMTTLGPMYLETIHLDPALIVRFVYTPETVELQVIEGKDRLPSSEAQTIRIQVLRKQDQLPLADVEAFLLRTLPDGSEVADRFPPTAADGSSNLTLDPLAQPNGSVIGYQVCLNVPSEERICDEGSYLIWD